MVRNVLGEIRFAAANQLYEDAEYSRAARSYERLTALGYDDPGLYYNLGNAYYKQGDFGRAVLSYRRAQRLAPEDRDLAANLNLARQQVADMIVPPDPSGPLVILANALSYMSFGRLAAAALAMWTAVGGAATWALLARGQRRRTFALRTLAVAAALLAFALVPGVSAALNYAAQDLSGNRAAYDHGEALLKSLPGGAVVLANSETTVFPLWYMRYVERTDLDLAVVAVPLLQFDWYRRELRQQFPGLVPEIETLDLDGAIEAIVVNNAEKGVYFTFNPASVSESFSAERQGLVWHVTAPSP